MDLSSIDIPKGLTYSFLPDVTHLHNISNKNAFLCIVIPFICIFTICVIRKRYPENSTKEDKKKEKQLVNILENIDRVSIQELEKTHRELLSEEVPLCGLKEVFFEIPPKGSVLSKHPTAYRLSIRDLLFEVQNKSHLLREREQDLAKWTVDIKNAKEEIGLLQSQLGAEEQLRIQAESKSSLMQKELEKLQKMQNQHNVEKEVLVRQIQQTQKEIEILKASQTGSDESTIKIEQMVTELKAEEAHVREEVLQLRATNKILIQKTAHDRQEREHLLRQRNELKERLSKLKPRDEKFEEDYDDDKNSQVEKNDDDEEL